MKKCRRHTWVDTIAFIHQSFSTKPGSVNWMLPDVIRVMVCVNVGCKKIKNYKKKQGKGPIE